MRYLVAFLTLLIVPQLVISESYAASLEELTIEHYPPYELVRSRNDEAPGRHLLPLGALEIIQQELVPEKSITVTGYRSSQTYYLPDARRTRDVAEYYEEQLAALGEVVYQCRGRTCGSSFFKLRRDKSGRAKAAVLPVPVCACPTTSLPRSMCRINRD